MKKHYSQRSDKLYQIGLRIISSPWALLVLLALGIWGFWSCVYCLELVGDAVNKASNQTVGETSKGAIIAAIVFSVGWVLSFIPHKKRNRKPFLNQSK